MSVRLVQRWYGVCDLCGADDDDSRPTAQEAKDRMWPDDKGRDLCWDCTEATTASDEGHPVTRPSRNGRYALLPMTNEDSHEHAE